MKKLRFLLSLALAALMPAFCLAPHVSAEGGEGLPPIDFSGQGAGYSAVLYDITNGLVTSEANAIIQSSDGFIWIGGYSGLTRYDGNSFLRYDSSYEITSVICLFVDSRGRLWIGTNDSGAAVLEDDELTFYNEAGIMNSAYVRVITEDENGNILIGTTMGVAAVDKDGVLRAVNEPQIKGAYIDELAPGPGGIVYGVTELGDVFTLRDLRIASYIAAESIEYGTISSVCPDPDVEGRAWLGTRNGEIVCADLSNGFEYLGSRSVSPHRSVNCIRMLSGTIWICADNGVGFFSGEKYIPLENLPMNNSIDNIMADHEGNLWFTSSRQGVMKIARNRFSDLNSLYHLESMVVNSTYKRDGVLYIGTDSGLVIIDGKGERVENGLTEYLSSSRIRCITGDSSGFVWFCTYGEEGLVRYDPKFEEVISVNEYSGLLSGRTRSAIELYDGAVAVATNDGVNILRFGSVESSIGSDNGLGNTRILCLEEDTSGRLYLGSDGDGVYIVDGSSVTRVGSEDGLTSEVILRLKRDPVDPNMFWVITSNSIAVLKDGSAETVESFPYNNNFDIFFDSNGRAWVLSSNGVYVAGRADLLDGGGLDYMFYDSDCGLPHITTGNSFSFLDEDGTLYMACSTGVTAVDINDLNDIGSDIRLAVPYLTVDDECVKVEGSEITIPSSCKRLTIHPFAFTYSLNNPRISYRLEGFDDTGFVINKRDLKELVYTNLDGGEYTFVLSVMDPLTGEASQTLRVNIIKQRALRERWWFWAGIAAAVIGAVILVMQLINRRRAKAMLKKQEEQRRYINGVIKVLSECVEMKDPYTNGHASRVAKYTALLAKKLGKSDEETEKMYNIAMLHDVGKISIPDAVLNKPERLTNEEYALMKSHAARGGEILKDVDIAPELSLGAACHHERYDGRGYPNGLKGEEIPEVARIIAVADTFDAMYSTRPYRKRMELSVVTAEIEKSAGSQLDPAVVKAFMELYHEGAFDKE